MRELNMDPTLPCPICDAPPEARRAGPVIGKTPIIIECTNCKCTIERAGNWKGEMNEYTAPA